MTKVHATWKMTGEKPSTYSMEAFEDGSPAVKGDCRALVLVHVGDAVADDGSPATCVDTHVIGTSEGLEACVTELFGMLTPAQRDRVILSAQEPACMGGDLFDHDRLIKLMGEFGTWGEV